MAASSTPASSRALASRLLALRLFTTKPTLSCTCARAARRRRLTFTFAARVMHCTRVPPTFSLSPYLLAGHARLFRMLVKQAPARQSTVAVAVETTQAR